MTAAALYRLQGVTQTYGPAFTREVDALDIFRGESLCLLGPTGANKSTLLRLLAGLEPPSKGAVEFEGKRLHPPDMPLSLRRQITMVHQRPVLLTGSVAANVEYGLHIRGVPQRTQKVVEVLKRLRLERVATQPAKTLPGGETQLVALARALVVEPDVLLLDELTANLDPAHVALVEEVVGGSSAKAA